jgi:hypothetical protein
MNAIAAHQDELEKLLEDFVERQSGLRDRFRGAPGCLHDAPRHELLRLQRPRQSVASANKRRINMEPTLTQNCALYYAQHKASKARAALFRKFRTAARTRRPDVRRELTSGDLFIVPRLHCDNGR